MRLKGGHNLFLAGKPSGEMRDIPEPEALHVPLFSRRLNFSKLCVEEGDEITQGQVLATDPANHSVCLPAPRGGTVRLGVKPRHVTLEALKPAGEAGGVKLSGETKKTDVLLQLGAWQFLEDAWTGDVPNPAVSPQAVIVSTLRLASFVADADVLLRGRMEDFERGLDAVHSLAGDKPLYLIVPAGGTDLTARLKGIAGKRAWLELFEIPLTYPFDDPRLAVQYLLPGKSLEDGPAWGLGIEGALGIADALGSAKPSVSRIISVGGPAARTPGHIDVPVGYPIEKILDLYREGPETRVINGGVLSGDTVPAEQAGVDVECRGLTLVPENKEREVLAFAHLGFGKHSYTNTFASLLRPLFRERYSTAVRGEHRPCLFCGACESVCPARITPHLVVRYAEHDRLGEAQKYGLWSCMKCGLCAYVCPSKIEHRKILSDAQDTARQEAAEAEAKS